MRRQFFRVPLPAGALFIFIATALVYLPALRAGFIWDDPELLTENPLIHAANGMQRIWFGAEAPDFFPLTLTSFWFEWRLFGENAAGYHAVNVALHAAGAALLWRILVRLRVPGALFAALLFALHPVNVASVAWIAERKNTLSMFFYLVSLLCWLRDDDAGDRRYYWCALIAFLCALLSKTSVVMLPVVLLGLAWWKRGGITRRDLQRTAPFFAASLLLGVVTIAFQHRNFSDDLPQDSLVLQVVRAGWIIGFYALKTIWPFPLSLVYSRWNLDVRSPLVWLPTLAVMSFFAWLWFSRAKGWSRHLLMGCGYFVAMLLPVCGIISMTFFNQAWVADWWQYAAMPGLLALVGAAGATLWRTREQLRLPLLVLGVAALSLLGWRTSLEARTYESLEINCRHALAANPFAWGIRNNLARELASTGRTEEALALYREGLRLEPGQKLTLDNLGKTLVTEGRCEEALPYCLEVVKLQPKYAAGRNSLGAALAGLRRYDEAAIEFREAVHLQPARIDYRVNLIRVLVLCGRLDEAEKEAQNAFRLAQMTRQRHQLSSLAAMVESIEKARGAAATP